MTARRRLFVISIFFAALAAAAAFLLLKEEPGADDRKFTEPPPANAPDDSLNLQPREAATAARIATVETRPVPKQPAAPVELKKIQYKILLVRVEKANENLFIEEDPGSPVGKGRTGSLEGWVTLYNTHSERTEMQYEILAGLNAGKRGPVGFDGYYKIGNLYPGACIIRFTTKGGRAADREIVILKHGDTRLDLSMGSRGFGGVPVKNTNGDELSRADLNICDTPGISYADGRGSLINLTPPKNLAYISAKGYERRREFLEFTDDLVSLTHPKEVILRRGSTITVQFDMLTKDDAPPVAVLLPTSMVTAQKYPFEKEGMKRANLDTNKIMFDGVPHQESFDICIFSSTANSVPPLRHLKAINSDEPVARTVEFSFEHRWPILGTVKNGPNAVRGARVRAEVVDLATATEKMFESNGGIDRVPYPPLPFARKVVYTDNMGKFQVETFDMSRPAYIIIESTTSKKKYIEMPPAGNIDLGVIQLEDAESSSIVFTFDGAARRSLTIYETSIPYDDKFLSAWMAGSRDANFRKTVKTINKPTLISSDELRTKPFAVAPGEYKIYIQIGEGSVTETAAKVDKETEVSVR